MNIRSWLVAVILVGLLVAWKVSRPDPTLISWNPLIPSAITVSAETEAVRERVEHDLQMQLHALLDPQFGRGNVAVALTCQVGWQSVTTPTVLPFLANVSTHGEMFRGASQYRKVETNSMWDHSAGTSSLCQPCLVQKLDCSVIIHADLSPADLQALEREVAVATGADPARGDQVVVRSATHWSDARPTASWLLVLTALCGLAAGVLHRLLRPRGRPDRL